MNPNKPLRILLILLVVFIALSVPASKSYSQRSGDVEKQINALLARMTLEEKLGQLQQLDGHGDGRFKDDQPELVRKGLLGSTLNVRGVKNTNDLQRIAVEQSRGVEITGPPVVGVLLDPGAARVEDPDAAVALHAQQVRAVGTITHMQDR